MLYKTTVIIITVLKGFLPLISVYLSIDLSMEFI